MLPFHRSFLQIVTDDGKIISKSANLKDSVLPENLELLKQVKAHGIYYQTVLSSSLPNGDEIQPDTFRMVATQIIRPPLVTRILQVAAPLTVVEKSSAHLLHILLILIPITLITALVVGVRFTKSALEPVLTMTQQAQRIESGELNERIPIPEYDPELSELAYTFNRLLNRLVDLLSRQQRFIADASHQFKTPLAIMKAQLERPEKEHADVFPEQVNHLIRLIENLLTLTRIDSLKAQTLFRTFRFDEMMMDALRPLHRLAAQRSIKLTFNAYPLESENGFEYFGDSELLKSMLLNLVENAIKYSPDGSEVKVEAYDDTTAIRLLVTDQGPGIAEDERALVFERFHRGKKTSPKTMGTGLGLPIAKSIAELHAGSISVDSGSNGGSTFTVILSRA